MSRPPARLEPRLRVTALQASAKSATIPARRLARSSARAAHDVMGFCLIPVLSQSIKVCHSLASMRFC